MSRVDEIQKGARVHHITEDLDGVIVKVEGDFIWVQKPGQREPEKSLPGFWEITSPATQHRAA